MPTKKTNKYSDGAFVVWNARLKSEALDPEDVRSMALAAGLPESIVPEYAGDRQIVSRVLNGHSAKLKKLGYVLSPLKRTKSHVLMSIHETSRDIEARETELPQTATLEWTPETGGIISPEGHDVAVYLDGKYQELLGKITGTDWSSTLTDYLVVECYAQAWRDDGRVYWIPPIALNKVRELQDWLGALGVSLAIAEIDGAVRDSVVEVVETSLVDQLDELQNEVDNFNGLQKPSMYVDRIEQYHDLRKRVIVHTETLGIAKATAGAMLDKLEAMSDQVEEHLEYRQTIRVKRDGTVEDLPQATQQVESTEERKGWIGSPIPVAKFDW